LGDSEVLPFEFAKSPSTPEWTTAARRKLLGLLADAVRTLARGCRRDGRAAPPRNHSHHVP